MSTEPMPTDGIDVILTHERTDFDALASLLGASLLYPAALPVLPARMNRNVRDFVALYRNQFPFVHARELPRQPINRIILVDTRSANLPKGVRGETTWYVIDHHTPTPDASPQWGQSQVKHWHEPVGANATMLIEKLMRQPIDLTPVQATLLALGIHEDTGSLTYATATARDARCLAWLMERAQGVNLEVLHQFLRHPLSEPQRALLDQLIEQSEFLTIAGHTVVIAQADAPGFDDELSTLVHRLRDVHECDAVFLIVRLDELVQVVARSVTDDIDVGAAARALGGGGHTRAAAAPVRHLSAPQLRDRIVELLSAHTQPAVTVRHIMTSGRPQVLAPDLRIEEAHLLMRRYGHEGFPVVAQAGEPDEALLGVLTRREADRAMNHGLGQRPVRQFMQVGPDGNPVTVRPSDSIHVLRRAMIESGWGQIPVVDEAGKIIGIVTRTDLIKLWDEDVPPERHAAEIDHRLRATLAPAQLALLQRVGQAVEAMDFAAFVVGGFVRDLLLNSGSLRLNTLDVDIVIEGDAIVFAQGIQAQFGGRIVTHKRFGTAKWILDDVTQPVRWGQLLPTLPFVATSGPPDGIPPHLDFVTARTEFYTAPTVLPTVELSNIKLDLHRRDFTINTLAFSLNPDRWGELLDFFGGHNDLRQGLVRVLHSLSFVDDPTRILRAVRYEQRFGFTIEPRTLELLHDAVELVERVSPARIRHELERILQEATPERALGRLDALGVLQHVHSALTVDEWVEAQFVRLRTALQQPDVEPTLAREPIERLYWGILTLRLPGADHSALTERLGLRGETKRLMNGLHQLRAAKSSLRNPAITPSQVVELLEHVDDVALALYRVLAIDPAVAELVRRYRDEWQPVQPLLTGADLQQMRLPPGPIYGRILARLRAARLDGQLSTRDEEEALARAIAQEAVNGTRSRS